MFSKIKAGTVSLFFYLFLPLCGFVKGGRQETGSQRSDVSLPTSETTDAVDGKVHIFVSLTSKSSTAEHLLESYVRAIKTNGTTC